jgi:hypothetical protein
LSGVISSQFVGGCIGPPLGRLMALSEKRIAGVPFEKEVIAVSMETFLKV